MDRRRARRVGSRGAAALEFVLVLPVLLLLLAGTMTLGLASYAKFRMSDAAMVASRRCAATSPGACGNIAPLYFNQRWPDANRVCKNGATLNVSIADSTATVAVRCAFIGGVMQGLLGLSNFNINTSAATPF